MFHLIQPSSNWELFDCFRAGVYERIFYRVSDLHKTSISKRSKQAEHYRSNLASRRRHACHFSMTRVVKWYQHCRKGSNVEISMLLPKSSYSLFSNSLWQVERNVKTTLFARPTNSSCKSICNSTINKMLHWSKWSTSPLTRAWLSSSVL